MYNGITSLVLKPFLFVYLSLAIFTTVSILYNSNNVKSQNITSTSYLTDNNWNNGVSKTDNILLFENTKRNISLLQNAKNLAANGVHVAVTSISHDNLWIWVTIKENGLKTNFISRYAIKILK